MFHLESELSSVSVLPAAFCHLKCFVCSPKYFMRLMRVRDLRTYGLGALPQTKVIDLPKAKSLDMSAPSPQSTLRWILRCLLAFCLSTPIMSAIFPVRWDYPSTLDLARSHGLSILKYSCLLYTSDAADE